MTSHVAWIVLAAQLAAAVVRADPAPPAGGTAENRALVHLDRGVAAYRTGDYRRAHDELLEASHLAPDRPNPYRWLALTEVALGDCPSALVNIESFLSRVPASDPRVAELRSLRERCLRSVRPGEPRPGEPRPGVAALPAVPPPVAPAASAPPLTSAPLASPASPTSDAPADTPLIRRWWFWTAIGAVAVTAAGVTYGLTREGPSRLPVVICDAAGCHR